MAARTQYSEDVPRKLRKKLGKADEKTRAAIVQRSVEAIAPYLPDDPAVREFLHAFRLGRRLNAGITEDEYEALEVDVIDKYVDSSPDPEATLESAAWDAMETLYNALAWDYYDEAPGFVRMGTIDSVGGALVTLKAWPNQRDRFLTEIEHMFE